MKPTYDELVSLLKTAARMMAAAKHPEPRVYDAHRAIIIQAIKKADPEYFK